MECINSKLKEVLERELKQLENKNDFFSKNFRFKQRLCPDDDRIISHDAPRFILYYHCVRDTSLSVIFSTREVNSTITVLDVDGFQTCFGSAASAFEIIELAYIHCALKENFSVTLTKKGFT